jgi:hypothetical protein
MRLSQHWMNWSSLKSHRKIPVPLSEAVSKERGDNLKSLAKKILHLWKSLSWSGGLTN